MGGANVTCISKVQFTYHSFIRLTILGHYATGGSIRENEFLFFWLACLELAVSLRVTLSL